MSTILVLAEHGDGRVRKATLTTLDCARKIAEQVDADIQFAVLGHNVGGVADQLTGYGASKIHLADHADLAHALAPTWGKVIADIALAWVAAKPGITCVLAGVGNVDQLARNARGCSLQLTDEVIAQLDALSAPVMEKLGTNLDYWENEENSRSR